MRYSTPSAPDSRYPAPKRLAGARQLQALVEQRRSCPTDLCKSDLSRCVDPHRVHEVDAAPHEEVRRTARQQRAGTPLRTRSPGRGRSLRDRSSGGPRRSMTRASAMPGTTSRKVLRNARSSGEWEESAGNEGPDHEQARRAEQSRCASARRFLRILWSWCRCRTPVLKQGPSPQGEDRRRSAWVG